jgi:NTE family protein
MATWTLALGGGVLYGIAHLGVLEVLRDEISIGGIVGTSAGSIVGACFAARKEPREVLEAVESTNWLMAFRPTLSAGGLLDSGQIEEWMVDFIGAVSFVDLQLPFAAVAAELTAGEAVVLNSGSVCRAVSASSAVPGIFTPVDFQGQLLVDGGVVDNVPAGTARDLFDDSQILAVNVSTGSTWSGVPEHTHEIVLRSIQLLQRHKSESEAAVADVVITPDLSGLDLLDIEHAGEMYERGRRAAAQALSSLRTAE